MGSVLDIPDIRDQAAKMTVSQYHKLIELGEMDQNVELLAGFVIEKISKSPLHTIVVKHILEILAAAIASEPLLIRKKEPLSFHDSEPEPDLAVVELSKDDYRYQHPATAKLVIEVAVTSYKIDQTKAKIYARAGVEEYWIVRPEEGKIEVFLNPEDSKYIKHNTYSSTDTVESVLFQSFQVNLATILS